MRPTTTFLAILLCLAFFSCTKNNKPTVSPSCQKAVIIQKDVYNNTNTNNYSITNAVINGDCLQLTYGSSGCSGNTWVADLIDASEIAKTNPPQRYIKLKLTNTELCAAVFSKTATFDLTPLRVLGSNSVSLVLAGYSGALIYNY